MTCDELAARLTDFLEGELGIDEADAIAHVAECAQCETVLRQTKQIIDLAGGLSAPPLSDETVTRLQARLINELQ